MLGWVQDVLLQIDILQFLKFKQRYVKMGSFWSTIPIWSLNHKLTIRTTIKSIWLMQFWRIFVWKFSANHYQSIWQSLFLIKSNAFNIFFWTSTFRRIHLNYENCSLRNILFQMLKYSDYKSLIAKTFEGNIKNESCKWYLGNQEQKKQCF